MRFLLLALAALCAACSPLVSTTTISAADPDFSQHIEMLCERS
ncbi:MAG: hypothetical protein AAF809_07955 [Bacteroidota bacterium]